MDSSTRRSWAAIAFALVVSEPVAAIEVGAPQLVSHSAIDAGAQTSGICFAPVLSPTGRFVLFTCQSSDVVDGEPGIGDLIQNDSDSDVNRGVGLDSDGQWGYCQGAELGTCGSVGIVSDTAGQRAVFDSGAPLTPDAVQLIPGAGTPYVFLRDEAATTTALLTPPPPNQPSPAYIYGTDASIERSEVLFTSVFNLLGGPDSNGLSPDLYVRNWINGTVELISAAPDGSQGDSDTGFGVFSPDGRYVAFLSSAANLTDDNPLHLFNLFLRDRYLGTTRRLTFPSGGGEFSSSPFFTGTLRITADDQHLLFGASGASFVSGDNPSLQNLYLLDLNSGAVEQLPFTVDGLPPNASVSNGDISNDGQRLVFASAATNIADSNEAGVFLQDLSSVETARVSAPLGALAHPQGSSPPMVRISSDGSALAFEWPIFDPVFPTLFDSEQIYRVAVHASPSASPTTVPAMSRLVATITAFLIIAIGVVRLRERSSDVASRASRSEALYGPISRRLSRATTFLLILGAGLCSAQTYSAVDPRDVSDISGVPGLSILKADGSAVTAPRLRGQSGPPASTSRRMDTASAGLP